MRHTRGCGTGRPAAYFALHRIGFFVPSALRRDAAGSYPAFSPSPSARVLRRRGGLFVFCDTVRQRGIWPALPRLERKRIRPARRSCDRAAEPARQRFSTGIPPGGVRTFLSEIQRTRSDIPAPKLNGHIAPRPRARRAIFQAGSAAILGSSLFSAAGFPPWRLCVRF